MAAACRRADPAGDVFVQLRHPRGVGGGDGRPGGDRTDVSRQTGRRRRRRQEHEAASLAVGASDAAHQYSQQGTPGAGAGRVAHAGGRNQKRGAINQGVNGKKKPRKKALEKKNSARISVTRQRENARRPSECSREVRACFWPIYRFFSKGYLLCVLMISLRFTVPQSVSIGWLNCSTTRSARMHNRAIHRTTLNWLPKTNTGLPWPSPGSAALKSTSKPRTTR